MASLHYEGLPVTELEVFHFEEDKPSFENFAKQNGFRYWLASELSAMLGYEDMAAVRKAMNKAMTVCMTLNIPVVENFVQVVSDNDRNDMKLSRFACYLTVMNGDVRNPKIARAQQYFVGVAEAFQQYVQEAESVERILIRGEVSEREKSLSATAHASGVQNYAFFQNAGYRGMYNMNLAQLKNRKGLAKDGKLLDFMGKEELAANLFRITQTEAKIRNEKIQGQARLENAAETVGRTVRNTMIQISNTRPEDLPLQQSIKEVQKGIKQTHKEYKKLDKPAK